MNRILEFGVVADRSVFECMDCIATGLHELDEGSSFLNKEIGGRTKFLQRL